MRYAADVSNRTAVVRRDILVSYVGSAGKSGHQYARLFAQENHVSTDNVVDSARIGMEVKRHANLQAIVVLDDFVGTGKSAADGLRLLNENCGDILDQR